MNLKRRIRGWIGGLAAVALVPGGVAAQVMTVAPDAFTARPITLIVPFPAGGPSDALARAIAQGMSIDLKQPIVVENISGAGGTIGLTKLAKSAPDGYTFGFGTVGTHVANAALYKKLPYDPLADFDAVGLAGTAPTILLARPFAAGVQSAGIRRLCRRQPRHRHLWQRRCRLDLALCLRDLAVCAQTERHSRAVSGCRSGDERPHGRTYRCHVRPVDHVAAAGHRRQGQSSRRPDGSEIGAATRCRDRRQALATAT